MHPVYTIRNVRTQGRMSMLPGPRQADRTLVLTFQNKQHAQQVKLYSFLCTLMKRNNDTMLTLPKKIDPRLVDKALLRPIPIHQLMVDTCDADELRAYYALHNIELARVIHVIEHPDCFYLQMQGFDSEVPVDDSSERVFNHLIDSYAKSCESSSRF